jgi:hypothetical protein
MAYLVVVGGSGILLAEAPAARVIAACGEARCERKKSAGIAGAFFASAMTVRTAGS